MAFLFFINLLLFTAALIAIIILFEKVSSLSRTVENLSKGINSGCLVEKTKEIKSVPKQEAQVVTKEAIVKKEEPVVSVQKSVQVKVEPENIEIQKEDFELQNVFLGNIFNKIGAVALIVALVIFIKLVSPFIILTPLVKTLLGFVSGFGLIGGSLYMHRKENLKNYSEVLLGTGFATLFITTFCGYSLFSLYNTFTAVSIGSVLLIATFLLADKMKTPSMLVIGLIGGYLTPVFSGTSPESSMSYLIFLNIVSIIYTLKTQRHSCINIINLIFTMIAFMPYIIEPVKVVYPLVLWGIYILYDILRDKSKSVGYAITILNYAVLTIFTILMFHNAKFAIGVMFLTTAIAYAGLALYSFVLKNELYKTYIHYILLNLWFCISFLLNDVHSVIAWSLVAVILASIVYKFKLRYLTASIIGYCITAFIGALLAKFGTDFCLLAKYTPIFNVRTLVFGMPVLSMLCSGFMLKKDDSKTSNLLTFSGISLLYLYSVGEVNSLLYKIPLDSGYINFNRAMLFSIIGCVYALHTKRLYNFTRYTLFNVASWIIYPISLLILFVWTFDYHLQSAYMPVINLRMAAYITAILVNVVFARWTKSEFFKYLSVFLGLLIVHFESVGLVHLNSGINYLISLVWVLYSGLITICGIVHNKKYLINSGIFLVILTILRIFVFDLAKVEALYKLVAFFALGIILMLVSYVYTLTKKK